MSERWSPGDAPRRFAETASAALDVLLGHDPVQASWLGDHRFDSRLADWSASAVDSHLSDLSDAIGALDDIDDTGLEPEDVVDLELLRSRLTARQWSIAELAEHTWNPLVHLPGDAIYSLLARPADDPAQRAQDLVARLHDVPGSLASARALLRAMPAVHVETAVVQARGAIALLGGEVDALVDRVPEAAAAVDDARSVAAQALEEHARWLADQVALADGDPRLGDRRFAAALWSTLGTETGPDALLTRAESHLMELEERIAETAAAVASHLGVSGSSDDPGDLVRAVLGAVAGSAPVTDSDVLQRCAGHLQAMTHVVREQQLVSVPHGLVEAVRVIEMPEVRRGVAVAYCDPPGALEPDGPTGPPATFFAVSPTPAEWSHDRVRSFYREYNDHMLRNLTVHEAMPGHVLQLAHARSFRGSTPVRAALWSGTFVEGWAVYAEQLVADASERRDPAGLPLRLQQLKMQLRCTINAILDVRVHTRGMTEAEAMRLMTQRGHQEDGEAAGKWRRALLSHAQLSTYFVGHGEVSALVDDLATARPQLSRRQVHDEVLAHGSPSPRLLRTLLDLS
ncbi:MAG TPA: DUF885 domain-containing protein [Actinomycetales bacterium]|nr:DUF885 domain-containing protein [Actinomycetales bacterium]